MEFYNDIEDGLLENGLLRSFDNLCSQKGDETAIYISSTSEISYLEIQFNSEAIAAQLFHRFGVSQTDRVAIACDGHAGAEITACLSCTRIGATFVPFDLSWHHSGNRLRDIFQDAHPIAAIVVARNDQDEKVKAFAKVGLHRCILINEDGSLNLLEAADVNSGLPQVDGNIFSSRNKKDSGKTPPLYILYTSGSTGIPKGVCGTEDSLLNRVLWQWRRFPWQQGELVCRRCAIITVSTAHLFIMLHFTKVALYCFNLFLT